MWLRACCTDAAGRALLAGVALGACAPAWPVDVPPIRYTGEFLTTVRVDVPEEGDNTTRIGSSAILGASTYLWQPWFATVDGDLNLSQITTTAETDSTATVAGGGLQLNVFPRSRFPFTAFVSLDDNRTEFDSIFVEQRDRRLLRYGVQQQYRPLSGTSSYGLLLERREDSNSVSGPGFSTDQSTNRLDLTTTQRFDRHNLSARFNLEQTTFDERDEDALDLVGTVQHNYRPSDTLTIDNFASWTDTSRDAARGLTGTTDIQLTSFTSWNPRNSKLSVNGNVQFNGTRVEFTGNNGVTNTATRDTTSGNVTARYELTPSLRLSGSLSGGFTSGDSESTFTSQAVSLAYTPPYRDIGEFQYSHTATLAGSNDTDSERDATQNVTGSFSHALSRVRPIGADGAFTLSSSLGQTLDAQYDSFRGNGLDITHQGSLGIAHAGVSSNSRALLNVQDTRPLYGDREVSLGGVELQTANLTAQHDHRFGRFATLGASANLSWTRQSFESGGSNSFSSSNLSVLYRHGRFFGVRRLLFTSQLTSTADNLMFFDASGDAEGDFSEIEFENHLYYTIGRVEAELELTVTRIGERFNSFVFFSLKRRIAGIF